MATIFNGGIENNKYEFGTGFVVKTNLVGQIANFKPVNHRIRSLKIRGEWHNYTLISKHTPTEDKKDSIKDELYNHLQKTIDLSKLI